MRVLKSIILLFTLTTSIALAGQTVYVAPPNPCEISLTECIEEKGRKYNVSTETMTKIVWCESRNLNTATNLTEKEFSVGLVQINLYAHKHITEEQGRDTEFAIDFLAENLAKGKADSMWYICYEYATN